MFWHLSAKKKKGNESVRESFDRLVEGSGKKNKCKNNVLSYDILSRLDILTLRQSRVSEISMNVSLLVAYGQDPRGIETF